MKNKKHNFHLADSITLFRMIGALALVAIKPPSALFFLVYAITGLTDAMDGWIARKTYTASEFGARLDSLADLLFYAVILLRIFPFLRDVLPKGIWYAVAVILVIRGFAYIVAIIKYRKLVFLHTYLNKLTGIAVFLIPFILITEYAAVFCWITCAVAVAASLEELVIHLQSRAYHPNTKSIFHK